MSFGFGVGDFIAVGNLAWDVHKACKNASNSFGNISQEVLSLYALLKEVEEVITTSEMSDSRLTSLSTIARGCRGVLTDLQTLVNRYQVLVLKTQRTWDRMKCHAEDLVDLRLRLISNTGLLSAFMNTTQLIIEQKLSKFMVELKEGHQTTSVFSSNSFDSLTPLDKETWRTIRKDLEEIGILVVAFDTNKVFIMEWFRSALATGSFDEDATDSESENDSSDGDEYYEALDGSLDLLIESAGDVNDQAERELGVAGAVPRQMPQQTCDSRVRQSLPKEIDIITLQNGDRRLSTGSMATKPVEPYKYTRGRRSTRSVDGSTIHAETGPRITDNDGGSILTKQPALPAEDSTRLSQVGIANSSSGPEKSYAGRPTQRSALIIAVFNGEAQPSRWMAGLNQRFLDSLSSKRRNSEGRLKSFEKTKRYIDTGADINVKDEHGRTSLFHACQRSWYSEIEFLLQQGADPNIPCLNGLTPLLAVAMKVKAAETHLLLQHGASVLSIPSLIVLMSRYYDGTEEAKKTCNAVVHMLVEAGAIIDQVNTNLSPLMLSIESRNDLVLENLLTRGADPRERLYGTSVSLLYFAIKSNSGTAVRLLIKHGANANDRCWDDGPVPLDYFTRGLDAGSSPDVLDALLDGGAVTLSEQPRPLVSRHMINLRRRAAIAPKVEDKKFVDG